MSLVHNALKAAALAALLSTAALTGCSGSHSGGDRSRAATAPVPRVPDLGVPARLATCADWRRGRVIERQGTILEIRSFAGGPVGSPAGHGAVLPNGKAYALFQRACAHRFARDFKLYKLYTRAASFTPQSPGA